MKSFFRLVCLVVLPMLLHPSCTQNTVVPKAAEMPLPPPDTAKSQPDPLPQRAAEAFNYCKGNGLNRQFCFLLDMGVHSGKNRFYIWDFEQQKVVDKGLVSHGCCKGKWGRDGTKDRPVFSNEDGSHCSSLGKYKVGERGHSQWGINVKYLLHGLDGTNSNAMHRYIVLHGWNLVADGETYPQGAPEGWGCPAVSNGFMRRLDKLLQDGSGNVLLWMYD